ncbi:MAG: amidohydrolase family protein [Actinomycetia bacterium]|nr:amidohydrolase family protein [Actinomycetes bacterium]
MLVVQGTVVTMRPGGEVLDAGAVYVGDDGLIAAVTAPGDPEPGGFQGAPRVAAGGLIYPGLIDLHNHLLYNSLPLWTEPTRTTPWTSHAQWVKQSEAPSYRSKVSAPARLLGEAAGRALLRYVETRALVGGTTCVQGNPKGGTPRDRELVRNIDSERLGTNQDFIRVRTIVADTLDDLEDIITAVGQRRGFIYHAAEGTDPTLRDEFALLVQAKLIRKELMMIHGGALTTADFQKLANGDATLVWSPFSNLWLYGATADIAAAKAAGVRICLGSDWAPSGTRNVLWELKVAELWNQEQPAAVFTDEELVRLVTANPGQALSGVWPHPVGRLEPGALGDLVVVASRHPDPYRNLIQATETDVRLVVVGGHARYGTRPLMAAAGAATATPLQVGRLRRAVDYGDASVTWAKVLAELDRVRKNPQQAADRAADALAAFVAAGPTAPDAPLVLLPDMPAPETDDTVAGPLTVPEPVKVPAPQPIIATRGWFNAVDDNPVHHRLLSGLRRFA